MSDKFHAGDKVRIIKAKNPAFLNTVHTIKSNAQECVSKDGKKWRGYDIGLRVEGASVFPRDSVLERVYQDPLPGLALLTAAQKKAEEAMEQQ